MPKPPHGKRKSKVEQIRLRSSMVATHFLTNCPSKRNFHGRYTLFHKLPFKAQFAFGGGPHFFCSVFCHALRAFREASGRERGLVIQAGNSFGRLDLVPWFHILAQISVFTFPRANMFARGRVLFSQQKGWHLLGASPSFWKYGGPPKSWSESISVHPPTDRCPSTGPPCLPLRTGGSNLWGVVMPSKV